MDSTDNKKISLESMSKEDLIKKHKNLLVFMQKLKVVKDELQEENTNLKKQLGESQTDNVTSELLEKLTNEKLILVTEIEDLKVKKKHFEEQCSKLETENVSYGRQIKRLTDENDQLISDLSVLEAQVIELHKLGVEQKSQLLDIEKASEETLTKCTEEIKCLKEKLRNKENEVSELMNEVQALKIIQNNSNGNTNCDKINEIEDLKLKNEHLISEVSEGKNLNQKLKDKVTLYHAKLKNFALKIKEIKEEKSEILNLFKSYTEQIKEWKEQLYNVGNELDKLVKDLQNENVKLQEAYEAKTEENQSSLCRYEAQLGSLEKEIEAKQVAFNELKKNHEKLQEELKLKNENLLESIQKYTETNANLIVAKEKLKQLSVLEQSFETEQKFTKESNEEIQRLSENIKQLEEKLKLSESNRQTPSSIADLKRENSELLSEMNQMNQALKERGESISQLEVHCEEMEKKLQLYEFQASRNVEKEETIRNLSKELDSLRNNEQTMEISNLKAEIVALKDRLQADSAYADTETMSTSTISRSEEANRLKDLEGSWEERYGKLRTLAVKFKSKIKELEKEREQLLTKQTTSVKTIQSLQKTIDELQDDFEESKKENKQLLAKLNSVAENISKDKQQLVENEEVISKLQKEIEELCNDKKSVDEWKKKVSGKIQTLRKELEAKNLLIKEAENRTQELENELKNRNLDLQREQDSHKQTKNLLEQSSNECKKNSMLNLEMQDYERSVKELTQKIEKQTREIQNLHTQLETQKNTVSVLREQNKLLEERIEEEQKNGNSTSIEISAYKKNMADLEELVQQKDDKLSDLNKLIETVRSENEELSRELPKVISEHQKTLSQVKGERDRLRNELLGVQQNLRDVRDVLKLREDELETMKTEYENYKVRAQSILKKNQNRDLGMEEKLQEEVSDIKSINEKLKLELSELKQKFDDSEVTTCELKKERDQLNRKIKEMEIDIEELRQSYEQLNIKHQKTVAEHVETVRNLKVHADTLSQCYRQQLAEQEVRHNREIIELQSRLEKVPGPVETPVNALSNMPREEGEGSESVETNPVPNNVHPIPLERLLDSTSDDEMSFLKKSLLEQESKVIHLTALLSDTEQDLAKHVQMNKVLKEEIRRQQRSVEREEHAENLEYLKNVVFKFVTLNSGDERTRLVPVLNTILKLSPEEARKLTMVAKGDPGIKGWASYLPMWPSPNKP
ncbi:hypothetical protein ABEB36_011926 [Hypothenemus hampei]|uniref:GRIP domain-containing protein n=1 Tax=Hypothenemus hampei TaxID=57062 RepID=A0ABD1EBI8_HYPHA